MQDINLQAEKLPYTMGNSGDLIKHGILSEFVCWYCKHIHSKLSFYDPFGGRPCEEPINNVVANRIFDLNSCPLKSIQLKNTGRYTGSGHLVSQLNKNIQVFSSDMVEEARHDLYATGLSKIDLNGFNSENGYSILDSDIRISKHTLILIDPFYDLEHINTQVIQKILNLVADSLCNVVLYVLYENNDEEWKHFKEKHNKMVKGKKSFISLKCKAVKNSSINGESKFNSFVILYLHDAYELEMLKLLAKNIKNYAINLEQSIEHPVEFDCNLVT